MKKQKRMKTDVKLAHLNLEMYENENLVKEVYN